MSTSSRCMKFLPKVYFKEKYWYMKKKKSGGFKESPAFFLDIDRKCDSHGNHALKRGVLIGTLRQPHFIFSPQWTPALTVHPHCFHLYICTIKGSFGLPSWIYPQLMFFQEKEPLLYTSVSPVLLTRVDI